MTIPVPIISAAGITLPSYNDVLLGYQNGYVSIYGSDVSIGANTIDGQWLAIQAQAYFDLSQMIGVIYNSFGALAQGPFLDNMVALTGIARNIATYSTATVTCVGASGTVISNGVIGDNQGLNTVWDLPATVTIPSGGTVNVTATCTTLGAITASAGTLTQILTPTANWNSVNNIGAAVVGVAVEPDSQLIQVQQQSVALSAETSIEAIAAAVLNVAGVTEVAYLNNDTNSPISGVPAGNFAIIVEGGTTTDVAQAIASKKPPGIPSYGTTSVIVFDTNNVPDEINFYEAQLVELLVEVTISPLANYQAQTGQTIINNVVSFINSLNIAEPSYLTRLYSPANNGGVGVGATYVVTGIQQSIKPNALGSLDLTPSLYQQFYITAADVTIVT